MISASLQYHDHAIINHQSQHKSAKFITVPGHPLLFRHPCIGSLLVGSLALSLVLLGGLLSCKVPLVTPGHLGQCSRATIRGKYQV